MCAYKLDDDKNFPGNLIYDFIQVDHSSINESIHLISIHSFILLLLLPVFHLYIHLIIYNLCNKNSVNSFFKTCISTLK